MADPVTLTAATIAGFAFSKFFESSVGKLGEKFTAAALAKMDELRKKIWDKLRGNSKAVTALTAIEQGSKADLTRLEVYLEDEMNDDPQFAEEVKKLAEEIHAGKIQDNSHMVMNIDGQNNTGYQTKNEVTNQGGTNYTGNNTINNNYIQP
ncbi:hypothetical protein [Anabaena sp. PCC 7108]|uniref:hypothetical protein n=1 Tax=Anabaena sp. PCC 7108 TaxID=163908 RepID=UPI000347440C|nr:hypothetical protein [Anabaena sp. PCC 7108]